MVPSSPYPNICCLQSSELCGVNFYCRSAHRTMSVRYRIVFRIAESDSRVSKFREGNSSAPQI